MIRLIDADALNDAMYHEAFENDESYNEKNPMAKWDSGLWIRYKMFENVIDEQPTIEPKHGEWIVSYTGGIKQTECSACGTSFTTYDVYGWHYCPWCGAKMKGADDETDNI